MKKLLGFLSVLGACVITALLVLYFLDVITVTLWAKYLFLLSCLVIILFLYFQYGKRTLFEDCLFCLRKAKKKFEALDFGKKERLVGLSLLTIKNYLTFAEKYTEDIYFIYDLHNLKQPIEHLNILLENLTKSHQAEIQHGRAQILSFLIELQKTLAKEQHRIIAEQIALKKEKHKAK